MPIPVRDPLVLLNLEARKKPEIAELLSNVHSMSEEDIKALRVMAWIKTTLINMKRMQAATKESEQVYANMREYLQDKIVDGNLPDPMGETRRWIGDQDYVLMDHSMVEIKQNQLIWIDDNGVWLDTIHSKRIDPKLRNTIPIGPMTRGDYLGLERQRRNGTMDAPPHTVVYGGQAIDHAPASPVAGMFTVWRPGAG